MFQWTGSFGASPHPRTLTTMAYPAVSVPLTPGPHLTGIGICARRQVLVVTSQALPAAAVLDALPVSGDGTAPAPDDVAVMVVAPEWFGQPEAADDETHYVRARRAEMTTVQSLRAAGVRASGHVGDDDPLQATENALAVFPADQTIVFAHPDVASTYRARVDRAVRSGRLQAPVVVVDLDLRTCRPRFEGDAAQAVRHRGRGAAQAQTAEGR